MRTTPSPSRTVVAAPSRRPLTGQRAPSRHRLRTSILMAALLVAALVPSAAAEVSAATIDGLNCTGYPEKRVFLESQAWWFRTPGKTGTSQGHVHVGTCFPHRQKIAGVVRFDVRVIMHDNPGVLTHVNIGAAGEWGSIRSVALTPNWRCATTCTRWFRVYVDTRKIPRDGRQEFRFRAQVKEPDGKEMIASTGWLAWVSNGRTVQHYRSSWSAEARGWYTDAGYANAKIDDLPLSAVSGIWRPTVRMSPGSGGVPVTSYRVILDPDFHAGKPGTTVRSGSGSYKGAVSIDTTKLRNGKHKLVLIADAATSVGSTNRGVMVVPFTVSN